MAVEVTLTIKEPISASSRHLKFTRLKKRFEEINERIIRPAGGMIRLSSIITEGQYVLGSLPAEELENVKEGLKEHNVFLELRKTDKTTS